MKAPSQRPFPFQQENLAELCCEREPDTGELTIMNHCYGIGEILRRYAGLPEDEPLAFGYEHVIPFTPGNVKSCDLNDGLPAFLTSIPEQVEPLRRAGFARPVAGGFGIHYARRVLESELGWSPPPVRSGTLAFPAKSTIEVDRSFDFEEYARHLASLPSQFQPVAVSIYWKDYLKGNHRHYEDRGIPVYTCGNMFDPLFLFRFIDLCSRFRYSCSNSIASSYPLSVVCGCHFFWNQTGEIRRSDPGSGPGAVPDLLEAHSTFGSQLAAVAPFPPDPALLARQHFLAGQATGRDELKQPDEIRELQQWSRRALLSQQESRLSFASRVEHAVLNRWLRRHLYNDGWAKSGASVTPAAHPGLPTFEVYLKISPKVSPQGLSLEVSVGSEVQCAFHAPPGIVRIRLPMTRCREKPVVFRSSHGAARTMDREVDFRFIALRLTADELPAPDWGSIPRKALPKECSIPQGW